MEIFNDILKKILVTLFVMKEPLNEDFASSEDLKLLELKDNTIFVERAFSLEHIYIFISGIAYVVNYTQDGRRVIADTYTDPQIYGLLEAIQNRPNSMATVITLSKSKLVKINKDKFLKAMYTDLEISKIIIGYLANLSIHSMKVSAYKTTISHYDSLIVYLYNKTMGKKLPHRITDNKAFLADSLQINKRTLYRYLNKLADDGIITRELQDIIVSEANFKKIEKLFNTLNDI